MMFAEQTTSPRPLIGRQNVQNAAAMKKIEFQQRLNRVMLDSKRAEINKGVEECNMLLAGWNQTQEIGTQLIE